MKTKSLYLASFSFIVFLGLSTPKPLLAMIQESVQTERRKANLIDFLAATIVTQAINEYLLSYPQNLSLLKSASIGGASWLIGEIAEAIYKKTYKKITGKNIRSSLGKSVIFSIEFDNQRLLRRILTLIPIFLILQKFR